MNKKEFSEKIIRWIWESLLKSIIVPIIYLLLLWLVKEFKLMTTTTFILIAIGGLYVLIGFLYAYDHERDKQINSLEQNLKTRITDLDQGMVIPLYYALSNAKNIVLLNDDRNRMEVHKEEYVKKYGHL